MRKSIATVSLPGKLPDKLQAIASAGFDGVEIFEPNLLAHEGTARDVARLAADLGLAIDLFQPLRDFEGVPDEQLRVNLERAEGRFDVMGELGAPLMLVCSNAGADVSDDDGRAAAQLHALAECAARRNLRVGYEALAWGTRVATFDRAWRIVERASHSHLGLILDSFHTLVRPDDWSALGDLPGNRIFFVQVGDAPRMNLDPLTLRRNYSRLPGDGDFDVAAFLRAVLATGYGGTLSLEIFNEKSADAPLAAARAAMCSLRQLEAAAQ
jgi:4-hydroxyphenylpyruvate dioxygenase